jgi:hypothetical protein
LFVVPILVLSACGGGSDDGDAIKPVESTKPSGSPTPSATTAPTPTEVPRPASTSEAAELGVTVLGTNAAKTPEEQAVVDAWMTYWKAVSQTYDTLEPAPGLDSARGKPLTDVLDYLNKLKTRNHRSVGWTRENVLKISVKGDSAAISDCAENFSFEVDGDNKPVQDVTPFYSTIGQLTKEDGRWVVTQLTSEGSSTDCRT